MCRRAIHKEVFERHYTLAAKERRATAAAGNLPIQRVWLGFDADQLVLGPAIRTFETRYIRFRHDALPQCRLARTSYRMALDSAIEAVSRIDGYSPFSEVTDRF